MNKIYDTVIVGGGMVGATLACALADSDMHIAVLDHATAPGFDNKNYDVRVSAITPGSKNIFQAIGIWSSMTAQRVSCLDAMSVWDEGGSGTLYFDSAGLAQPCLGYIVENRVIRTAALERMAALRNVDYYCPVTVSTLRADAHGTELDLDDGSRLRAKLIVGADGAMSLVRRWAGIGTRDWSFEQKAIVATVRTGEAHRGVAHQRFLRTGPLAFLPLDEPCTCSIVWSADTPRADYLLALDDAAFITELHEAIAHGPGEALGGIIEVSERAAFPLSAAHAESYIDGRIVLVGDAAHRIHPLAGQGLNLGLGDIAALAEVLMDARRENRDIGSRRVLRRYERWRRGENALMLTAMDGFKRLFGNDNPLLAGLRNFGLDVTDTLTPVKHSIMRYAAGLAGDRPRLMRGLHP